MIELFLAEFKRSWLQFIRYPVEAIGTVAITTILFYGLFLSTRYIAGPGLQLGNRFDMIVIGYVLWILVLYIFNELATALQVEAQTGTLEQVFLSPFGVPRVFLIRGVASLMLRLVLMSSILLLIIVLTGRHLHFPPSLFLPLITVLLGAYGLSLLMGALVLLFKRVGQLLGLFQFGLLFLLAVPTKSWADPIQRLLLPMVLGADEIRNLMTLNYSLNLSNFVLALVNGVGYFTLGLLTFNWAEHEAKRRGLLSGY